MKKIKIEKEPKFKQPKLKVKNLRIKKFKTAEQLLPPSYRPLSTLDYFLFSLLYIIPVVGWVFMIVNAVNGKSRHGRSFARGFILFTVLLLAVVAVAFGMGYLSF